MTIGPRHEVIPEKHITTCVGCDYYNNEYYCIEDGNDCDSGYDAYCNHPNLTRKYIGDTYGGIKTPDWCPEVSK